MDDLKNLVIQTLEEEGTLGTLRAQLRSRVFKAIEKNAEPAAKQAAGFQWQNPAAQKVHESEESRLIAHMVKEYLDFYRMEYTLSVYTPEAALQNEQAQSRDELAKKAGIKGNSGQEPLLVQMLKQLKLASQQLVAQPSYNQQQDQHQLGGAARKPVEEAKKPQQQQQQQPVIKNTFYNNKPQHQQEDNDDINEEIVEDIDDDNNNNAGFNGGRAGLNQADLEGIAASASLGIDQSIDTLRLEEYDYIEEVKFY